MRPLPPLEPHVPGNLTEGFYLEAPPPPGSCVGTPLGVELLQPGAFLPWRATPASAGLDLTAVTETPLQPGEQKKISTQLAIALPEGTVGLLLPRSGLASDARVDVIPGVIDADYRGEVKIMMANHNRGPYLVNRGDRVAQLVVLPLMYTTPSEVPSLNATSRGKGGFGSSGGRSTQTERSPSPPVRRGPPTPPPRRSSLRWPPRPTELILASPYSLLAPGDNPGGLPRDMAGPPAAAAEDVTLSEGSAHALAEGQEGDDN